MVCSTDAGRLSLSFQIGSLFSIVAAYSFRKNLNLQYCLYLLCLSVVTWATQLYCILCNSWFLGLYYGKPCLIVNHVTGSSGSWPHATTQHVCSTRTPATAEQCHCTCMQPTDSACSECTGSEYSENSNYLLTFEFQKWHAYWALPKFNWRNIYLWPLIFQPIQLKFVFMAGMHWYNIQHNVGSSTTCRKQNNS